MSATEISHGSILYDATDKEERAKVEKLAGKMVDRALEMEGTGTGEHGVGLGKKESLVKELGGETVGVLRALDPEW